MRKKNRVRAILLLPIAAAIFMIGWIIQSIPSNRSHSQKKTKPAKAKPQDIQFLVGIEKEDEQILA